MSDNSMIASDDEHDAHYITQPEECDECGEMFVPCYEETICSECSELSDNDQPTHDQ